MLDVLSEDVIWRVFQHLDVKSRARLATVSSTFYRLLSKWEDVLYCSIRLGGITLAGENFIIELERHHSVNQSRAMIVPALKRCPLIRKLAIHDERALWNVDGAALRDLVNVDELHISSNFFTEGPYNSLVGSLFSFPKLHTLHIQQRYNEEKSHSNIIREHHIEQLISTSLSNIKLQGVIITRRALELICSKYRKTLETLCLLGALVSSQDLSACFHAINGLDRLTYLTLAPSLFSISTTNKAFFKSYPTLKDSKMLKLVAVYVSKPDVSQMKLLLQYILPASVEQLLLYDESYRLAYQIEQEAKEFKCKIQFCRDDDIIIDNYWMNGKSELLTHTLWKPPYKTNIFLPAMLPEWYCVLSELMETALMSEYSCRSSPSASTAQDASQLDELTCADHSFRSALNTDAYQTTLYTLQNKMFSDCCSFGTALERTNSLSEMTARSSDVDESSNTA